MVLRTGSSCQQCHISDGRGQKVSKNMARNSQQEFLRKQGGNLLVRKSGPICRVFMRATKIMCNAYFPLVGRVYLVLCGVVCYRLSVFVLHKNDTNWCESVELCAEFVRALHKISTNFVRKPDKIGNNHVHITYLRGTLGTNFVRKSHKTRTKFPGIRTNFLRTSYQFRTTFAGHWHKRRTNTTYACTEVSTPTHISPNLPPPPPGTHTHTHTDTHTCTPRHTHTINESKQPPTRPTPTSCPPAHRHTHLDS